MVKATQKAPRESNLELLRIFAMMAIVAHHSIVHGAFYGHLDLKNPDVNVYSLMLWGMWGKTAINSFILISGYFLCKGVLTWQRYAKLLIEMYFYKIIIMTIFMASGYQPFSILTISKSLVFPLRDVNNEFGASFLAFYMFVPIYNKLIGALNERQHRLLLGGLLLYFTFASTFLAASSMNEPLWYATLYMIAAYIRLYPNRWTESAKVAWTTLGVSVFGAVCFALAVLFVIGNPEMFHLPSALAEKLVNKAVGATFWIVSDSNKLLALVVGLSAFLAAKNAPKFRNKFINTLAAGTFAVLLIHDASDTMRQWLWRDVLDIPSLATAPIGHAVLVLLAIPVGIFILCSSIDYFRRKWVEKPVMKWLERFPKATRHTGFQK